MRAPVSQATPPGEAPNPIVACLLEAIFPGTGIIYAQFVTAGFVTLFGTFAVSLGFIFWVYSLLAAHHPNRASALAGILITIEVFWWLTRIIWAGFAAHSTGNVLLRASASAYVPLSTSTRQPMM